MRHLRRIRVAEYRAVAKMLESDHEDVVELSKNIVRMLNRMRAGETTWVRAVRDGSGYLLYGPYTSASDALGDGVSRGDLTRDTGDVRVYSLIPPFGQTAEEREDKERGIE